MPDNTHSILAQLVFEWEKHETPLRVDFGTHAYDLFIS